MLDDKDLFPLSKGGWGVVCDLDFHKFLYVIAVKVRKVRFPIRGKKKLTLFNKNIIINGIL